MRMMLVTLLILFSLIAKSQKAIDSLIATEKAFAAYAVANNTKDAFLKSWLKTGAGNAFVLTSLKA